MGVVVDLRAELVRRRRWNALARLRPWRVEKYDVAARDSRSRPGQLEIGRKS